MKVVPELVDVVKKQVEAGRTVRGQVGTIRVDLRHQEQKTFEAIYKTEDKEFHFLVDEPAIRGGLSRGPTPLGFFITGAGG